MRENLSNIVSHDIGNSPALNGLSLCGPVGFVIPWKDILLKYADSRQKRLHDIDLRIMGTFLYRSEIMYAVLVEYFASEEYFTWKVYSTVGFRRDRPYGVRRTWDHISFGFNCPTSNLGILPQLCNIIGKRATHNMPLSRSAYYEIRTSEAKIPSKNILGLLKNKTRHRSLNN